MCKDKTLLFPKIWYYVQGATIREVHVGKKNLVQCLADLALYLLKYELTRELRVAKEKWTHEWRKYTLKEPDYSPHKELNGYRLENDILSANGHSSKKKKEWIGLLFTMIFTFIGPMWYSVFVCVCDIKCFYFFPKGKKSTWKWIGHEV